LSMQKPWRHTNCGGMDIGGMLKEMLKYHNNQN